MRQDEQIGQSDYTYGMAFSETKPNSIIGPTEDASVVDSLVLSTTNAPYKRDITVATLAECIFAAEFGDWLVHVAAFFGDVSPDLVLRFASVHGISKSKLAEAYRAMKAKTGQQNPDLEAELVPIAGSAR